VEINPFLVFERGAVAAGVRTRSAAAPARG
jgi:hypothetical protein